MNVRRDKASEAAATAPKARVVAPVKPTSLTTSKPTPSASELLAFEVPA